MVHKIILFLFLLKSSQCISLVDINLGVLSLESGLENLDSESKCVQDFKIFMEALNKSDEWAIKMFDASTKLQSGIYSGNLIDLGTFDQCLTSKYEGALSTFGGKYCMASVPLASLGLSASSASSSKKSRKRRTVFAIMAPSPGLTLSYCIPDSCSAQEAQDVFNSITYLVTGNDETYIYFTEGNCQVYTEDTLQTRDWIAIGFFLIVLLIVVLSTAYDMYIQRQQEKPSSLLFVAFSVYTNGKKLFALTSNTDQIQCINGIRFLTMAWIIYAHRHLAVAEGIVANSRDIITWSQEFIDFYVLSATVSVDTFFLISGFLVCYLFLLARDKNQRFNIFLFYLHRYIRLTPCLICIMVFSLTLVRYFGSGPYWPTVTTYLQINCQHYWWSLLIYIQNYLNPEEICIGQTWYLSADMQLYILSPLLLFPLAKWPKPTFGAIAILVVGAVVSPYIETADRGINGAVQAMQGGGYNFDGYYQATHARYGPWVFGVILGYLIFKTRKNRYDFSKIPYVRLWNVIGWIVALGTMFAVVFGPYNMQQHEYIKVESSLYLAFHRNAWSIGVAWVIFSCMNGYGGIINSFLAWPIFQVLSKLVYTMYLTHLHIMMMFIGQTRIPNHFSTVEMMYRFWGDLFFTLTFSIIITLTFESPMIIIEKVLLGNAGKKKEELPTVNHSAQNKDT